jgi:hypothetical protein
VRFGAIEAAHEAIHAVAETDGTPDDCVEDRLNVGRRARDDAQDLGGRGLLLQRFGEVAVAALQLGEEPDVLDGDDGLVGEGSEQVHLPIGEGPRGGSRNRDRPDGPPSRSMGTDSWLR